MKTNGIYALTAASKREEALDLKLILAFVIVAMLFTSLPVTGVLAASASEEQPWEGVDLKLEWKNKLIHLRAQGFYYDHVQFYPADFDSPADLALARLYLDKYRLALRQANTVVLNHSGFDYQGNVTNPRLAYETVHDLAEYVHMMYGLRDKIEEVPGGR